MGMEPQEVVKRFTVPAAWFRRHVSRLMAATGTMNSRKIGRTRRGHVMLTACDAKLHDDATATVMIRLQRRPMRVAAMTADSGGKPQVRRFCLYKHGDVGKVIKDIANASVKLARKGCGR